MNRVTRLLQKTAYKARQRLAVTFGHKYVIRDSEVMRAAMEKEQGKRPPTNAEIIDKVVTGFDPEGDAEDRRILYEVTGMRLNRGEEFVI